MTEQKLAQMIPISWRKCYVNLANAICHLVQRSSPLQTDNILPLNVQFRPTVRRAGPGGDLWYAMDSGREDRRHLELVLPVTVQLLHLDERHHGLKA